MGYLDDSIDRNKKKKSVFSTTLVRVLEVAAIVLSILARSRIARFLSTKAALSIVVEVTDKFGAPAGHFLSTLIAAIVAEPMLIAYIVTGVIVCVNLFIMAVRGVSRR